MNSTSKEFCLSKWRKTVHMRGAAEDSERFVKEREEAFTTGDVETLKILNMPIKSKNIAEMADGNPVSKEQLTEIRDYFLTTLILHNGARMGVVENLHCQAVSKRKEGY